MMKVVPVGANVVVRRLNDEETTSGGVILPESAREAPQQGRVLSVGDGKRLANGGRGFPQVHEGDRVVFRSLAGNQVLVDGEDLLILDEDDILAIIE